MPGNIHDIVRHRILPVLRSFADRIQDEFPFANVEAGSNFSGHTGDWQLAATLTEELVLSVTVEKMDSAPTIRADVSWTGSRQVLAKSGETPVPFSEEALKDVEEKLPGLFEAFRKAMAAD